jgi:hypothetical protein
METEMKRILAALGVTGLALLGATAPAAADDNANDGHKITICHATGSASNPYVSVTIDLHALNAHKGHQHGGDIIPANDGKAVKEGRNLDKVHLIASGCAAPDGPPKDDDHKDDDDYKDDDDHKKITICHATGSSTNPYVEITVNRHALKGHARHQDGRDIIPGNSWSDGQNWDGAGQETYNNGCVPVEREVVPPKVVPPKVVPPASTPEKPAATPRGAVVRPPAAPRAAVVNNPGFNVQTAAATSGDVLAPWAAGLIVMLIAAGGVAARKALPAGAVRHRRN